MTQSERIHQLNRRIGRGWLRNHSSQIEKNQIEQRPTVIITDSSDAFFALCAREIAGEIKIESAKAGRNPGIWICQVRYLQPVNK